MAKFSTVCVKCGAFRAQWKNRLKYWSGVVGLFAFIASAGAFLYQAASVLAARTLGGRVEVLDFDTFGKFTAFNDSATDILLRNIIIQGEDPGIRLIYAINSSIAPGATFSANLIEVFSGQTHGSWDLIYGRKPGDYDWTLNDGARDGARATKPLSDLQQNDFSSHVVAYLGKGLSSYSFFESKNRDYGDFACRITVTYSVFRGIEHDTEVPCVGWARERSE